MFTDRRTDGQTAGRQTKGYRIISTRLRPVELQNKRTLLTYNFVIDTIYLQDNLHKRRNLLCLICK